MKSLLPVVAAFLLIGAAGCGHQKPGSAAETPSGSRATSPGLSFALVTDAGGIDDKSFNASAWAGLQKACSDLGLKNKPRVLESKEQGDYETNLASFADQGIDLVFAVGYLMEDALKKVAPRYPHTHFAIIDGNAPNLPNCASLKFREEEGALLAGYLAMRMSKTGVIGFVGGIEGALMKRFEDGYRAGARIARPDGVVVVKYIGSWTDVPKGSEIGKLLISPQVRADVVFAAAGKGGLGVLDAVAAGGPGYYGIGVDKDQDDLHPGRILTSMMKSVDRSVEQTARQFAAGKWTPGEHVLGVAEHGVGLSPMRFTKKDVPPAVLADLERLTRMVAEGKVKAPKTDEELAAFVPPSLK